MKRWLPFCVVMIACTGAPVGPTEAGTTHDADRPCHLPAQLELDAASAGTCSADPIVVLYLGDDGSVAHASAHVPVGVTVPLIACTSHAPMDAATCTWALDVVCDGMNAEHLAMTGTITGSGTAWTGDAVTLAMTGSPPGRLMCTATGSVASP